MKTRMLALSTLIIILASTLAAAETVTFRKSKMLDAEGKERDVLLILTDQGVKVQRKDKEAKAMAECSYESITHMEYERAKSARLKTALLLSPVVLFSKGKKHWLTIQYEGGAMILHLDKNEYRNVLGELEGKSGKKIDRIETK